MNLVRSSVADHRPHCQDELTPLRLPPTAAAEEYTGSFDIEGHRVNLRTRYWRKPAADSRVFARWQTRAAGAKFFHVQQAGKRPTFLGVICPEEELGREFTLELICGGWCWHSLRCRDVLFEVTTTRVQAYEGPLCRPAADLAEIATGHVLPRAHDHAHRRKTERRQQRIAAATIADNPWLRARHQAVDCVGGLVACALVGRDGKVVLITGAMDQPEAAALAEELARNGVWVPTLHGHLHVHFDTADFELALACPHAETERRLHQFVRRFTRLVVVSDLHLGVPPRDTFGPAKGHVLAALIRRAIRDRSTLVLNGDFLELLHERYGEIRRAYPEVFDLLPRVRRLLYLAGNHDDSILRENIKQTRRRTRSLAARHSYGKVALAAPDAVEPTPLYPGDGVRRAADWTRFLSDPDLLPTLREIVWQRAGSIWLSRGFASEGVAFRRLGPRDTDAEQPQWYLDESVLDHPEGVAHLKKLLADRRQHLDDVLRRDWGEHLRILRYHWDSGRGLYFEHGHFAVPECHGNRLGRAVGLAAGLGKRIGLRRIEHWFEEKLGGLVRRIHPFDTVRQIRQFAERQLAVATALTRLGGSPRRPTIICSHTHEAVAVGCGPVHTFVRAATGATYANTGAWSSRIRLRRAGDKRVEWLEVSATNDVRTRLALVPAGGGAG